MEDNNIILSILVISHNQKDLLQRCINSILQQKITFPYEIIISDDRSTDGTWELIQSFGKKHQRLIRGFQINSDECNPVNRSERCGFNKANAYKQSLGKYFVNIDADDYLIGDDIYQKQVEMLEANPQCNLCMQNIMVVKDGSAIEQRKLWIKKGEFQNGQIISIKEYILRVRHILNQAFVIRKNTKIDPVIDYGKHYDDGIITLHHLQFGKIVFVDKASYVYVKYANSIDGSLKNADREAVYGLLPIHYIIFIPKFAGLFMETSVISLMKLIKLALKNPKLTKETKDFLAEFDGFIYSFFNKDRKSFIDNIRLRTILNLTLVNNKFKVRKPFLYKSIFALLTTWKQANNIPREYWKF